jgi:hypothetical protein
LDKERTIEPEEPAYEPPAVTEVGSVADLTADKPSVGDDS